MKQPYATMQEFSDEQEALRLKYYAKRLKENARTAAAWGVPSQESTGYSQQELTNIIYQLLDYIERLEKCLK
jgi:hypothetical protein